MGEKSWMKKVVFFTDLTKFFDALENFDIDSFSGKSVPIKLHMGEIRNKYFLKPDLAKLVVDALKSVNAKPYLYDTTVAYPGLRSTKKGYEKVAKIHGFSKKKVGCDVVIDDNGKFVKVEGRNYEVASHIIEASHIFGLTHLKGHIQSGMGGAIKNFGMGCVTKETKRNIHHGSKPVFQKDACTYCGICAEVCPFEAIKVKENSWNISNRKCFGCGVCVDSCETGAIVNKDENFQYLLSCSAKACVQNKNVIYLNELKRIAKSCDCDPTKNKIICPDIGYIVSDDIVAIDKASLDLINNVKKDIFEKENKVSPMKQIKFGEEIGLGSSSYQFIEI
ncbi:MAG: hypothetical protein AYK22_07525 [Thermoplasmatales archaeon SG8-52-3]|nr:MAG: hypothetical protein AYK22_07525 [Thermoplasmatales archaeon SG8-52-3]